MSEINNRLKRCIDIVERSGSIRHAGVIEGTLYSVNAMPSLTPKVIMDERPNPMRFILVGWPNIKVERDETYTEMMVRFAREYLANLTNPKEVTSESPYGSLNTTEEHND